MSDPFREAHDATDYEIHNLQGLAEALYDIGIEYPGINNNDPTARAITALIVTIRDGLNKLSDLHNAEWKARQPAKAA